jgi:hypothetical protein
LLHSVHGNGACCAEHFKKARDTASVFNKLAEPSCRYDAEREYYGESDYHHYRLHKIRRALRQKSTHYSVRDHEDRSHYHHARVRSAEQSGKQLAESNKTACRVYREKYEYEKRGYRHDHFFVFFETVAEKIRYRNGVAALNAVSSKALRDKEPVEISPEGEAYSGPRCVREAAPIRHARQPHQQPAAHIRGFRAESRNPWAERTAAQKISFEIFVRAFREDYADKYDRSHIDTHRDKYLNSTGIHN